MTGEYDADDVDPWEEFVDRLVAAVHAGATEFEGMTAKDLRLECTVDAGLSEPAAVAQLGYADIDPEAADHLDRHVSAERVEEVRQGSELLPWERKIVRDAEIEKALVNPVWGLDLYQVTDTQGRSVYVTAWRGDGGEVAKYEGPFPEIPPPADWVEGDEEVPASDEFTVSSGSVML